MKRIILCISISLLIIGCKSKSNIITSKEEAIEKGVYSYEDNDSKKSKKKNKKETKKKASNHSLADKIVNEALDNIGVKYRLGGTTKSGMDCSGLVFSSFAEYDIKLPRTSIDMSRYGNEISKKKAQPGDLIFFKTNGRSVINHVGIVTEVNGDEIKFVHASTSKGVMVSSTNDEYYNKTFAQINRVID